ncbi:rifamycin-inactivating phosphotransferase [Pseudonocardia xishanensis]|uniref:Phosphoenolpyruvate synthase n=1 Tax=Pseudonocardia xishanensis TaxID=630995 RepID=A0ABP8S1S2_9PSEU
MHDGAVVGLDELGRADLALAGGKGANLGELTRIAGVRVPPGFCVTVEAYRRVVAGSPSFEAALDRLAELGPGGAAEVRRVVEAIPLPADLEAAITARVDGATGYAVRSSATAEDLPGASFAGQQDSYLNVVGAAAVIEHVRRCWASLFTERAVTYRQHHGIDHRDVHMAVVVQEMVVPDAAGILFTADPVSGNRRVATVDATWGLGDALVSGLVNADVYRVSADEIVAPTIGAKDRAVRAVPGGGTADEVIPPAEQRRPVLTDAQVVDLVRLGRRIEAHFGRPQDIEWCLVGDAVHIVQSRPITTLFPLPAADDDAKHVYVSVGHQQMMTDAMTPLGLSFWQRTTPRPMAEAGCRLFVDVAAILASPATRAGMVEGFRKTDPLTGDALATVVESGFLGELAQADPAAAQPEPDPIPADPELVAELVAESRASVAAAERALRTRSGPELFAFIEEDLQELRRVLFGPRSHQVIMAGMQATWWLGDHLGEWLGDRGVVDTLTQSVPHNVTSEMGLALLDVADVLRQDPAAVALLEKGTVEGLGPASAASLQAFLDEYGMRCPGEIDLTRPRWSERPDMLASTLLGNIRGHEPGAGKRLFDEGRRQAGEAEQDVLRRLAAQPDGERKVAETKAMIDRVRTFAGYREYPKYGMVRRYFLYKQALLREAERLVREGVLREAEDVFLLRFDEFAEVVRTSEVSAPLLEERREELRLARNLRPPRVFTSDGEIVTGTYRRDDLPPGALPGIAVSAGTVEGRARVVTDMANAALAPGDILVTAYTDPSWTPLFVGITGLVTEVGGLMTHGAVIAREYGLPAVVGVEGATRTIPDGRRIRVHGTAGYVELLE